MKCLFLATVVVLMEIAAAADDPISVSGSSKKEGYKAISRSESDFKTGYCVAKHQECPAKYNIPKSEGGLLYEGSARQCTIRCSDHRFRTDNVNKKECVAVYYRAGDRLCQLKDTKCAEEELEDREAGTQYFRIEKDTTPECSPGREKYSITAEYSGLFCMNVGKRAMKKVKGKRGQRKYNNARRNEEMAFYLQPQGGELSMWMNCLIKCANIFECTGVDMVKGKCDPTKKIFGQGDLIEDDTVTNYVRLEKGVTQCPPGSVGPISYESCASCADAANSVVGNDEL